MWFSQGATAFSSRVFDVFFGLPAMAICSQPARESHQTGPTILEEKG
jgi:hypothetical protein